MPDLKSTDPNAAAVTRPGAVTWTIAEFCTAIGISKRQFARLRAVGDAPAVVRAGRKMLILRDTGMAWLKGRETAA